MKRTKVSKKNALDFSQYSLYKLRDIHVALSNEIRKQEKFMKILRAQTLKAGMTVDYHGLNTSKGKVFTIEEVLSEYAVCLSRQDGRLYRIRFLLTPKWSNYPFVVSA